MSFHLVFLYGQSCSWNCSSSVSQFLSSCDLMIRIYLFVLQIFTSTKLKGKYAFIVYNYSASSNYFLTPSQVRYQPLSKLVFSGFFLLFPVQNCRSPDSYYLGPFQLIGVTVCLARKRHWCLYYRLHYEILFGSSLVIADINKFL